MVFKPKDETERHDRSVCTQCKRVFWGAFAFDQHRPCGETEMRGKYVIKDDIYVLKGDVTLYTQIKHRMDKARKSRGI